MAQRNADRPSKLIPQLVHNLFIQIPTHYLY